MWIRDSLLVPCACSALFLSGFAGSVLPSVAQEVSSRPAEQADSANPTVNSQPRPDPNELPDSPGVSLAKAQPPSFPQAPQPQTQDQSAGDDTATSQNATGQTTPPQRPVGTAAAEAPNTGGIAASEPAGVAIAPAKQRRARTIIIRTGAIIGAAVAVGVVVGLTEATGSKPPGAH